MNINPIKSPYFEWYDYVAYFLLSYQLGLRYINQFTKVTVVARHAANSPHNVHGQRSPSRDPPPPKATPHNNPYHRVVRSEGWHAH